MIHCSANDTEMHWLRCVWWLLPLERQICSRLKWKQLIFNYPPPILCMCDPVIPPRPGLWFPQEQKAWRMGGHTGHGGCCGLCRTGGLRPPEEQAEERLLPQEAGGGIPDWSGHVLHLSAYNSWTYLRIFESQKCWFFFFFIVLRLDNGEPLDFDQVAYYNSGLQADNIQMSNIPARYWRQRQNLLPIMFITHALDKVLLLVKTTSRTWLLWVQVKNTLVQIRFRAKDLLIYSIQAVRLLWCGCAKSTASSQNELPDTAYVAKRNQKLQLS